MSWSSRLTVPQSVRVRYVRNPQRLGFNGNLMAACEEASGEYLKFLCDDDQLLPECIARQVQVFIEHDDVNLVVAQRHVLRTPTTFRLPCVWRTASFASVDALFKGEDLLGFAKVRRSTSSAI